MLSVMAATCASISYTDAHNNALLVSVNDTVTQGQQIALVGSSGQSKGFHIHFEVKYNGMRVDPLQFFNNYTAAW